MIMHSEVDKKFAPCPSTPNCVSSLADNKKQYIDPMPYAGEIAAVKQELLDILQTFKRVRIVKVENTYIRAEVRSLVFGFVDDVEFQVDQTRKIIHIKSASRSGYSDLGVNRRRLEKIKQLFGESKLSRHTMAA